MADIEGGRYFGNAQPGDTHLAADVRATDDASLLAYIEHRRRWAYWHKLRAFIGRLIEGIPCRFR